MFQGLIQSNNQDEQLCGSSQTARFMYLTSRPTYRIRVVFKTSLKEKTLYGFNGKDTPFVTDSVISFFTFFSAFLLLTIFPLSVFFFLDF